MVLGTGDIGHIMVESSSGRRGVSMKRTVFARFAFGLCENETAVFDVSKVISSNPLPSLHPGDLVGFGVVGGNLKSSGSILLRRGWTTSRQRLVTGFPMLASLAALAIPVLFELSSGGLWLLRCALRDLGVAVFLRRRSCCTNRSSRHCSIVIEALTLAFAGESERNGSSATRASSLTGALRILLFLVVFSVTMSAADRAVGSWSPSSAGCKACDLLLPRVFGSCAVGV